MILFLKDWKSYPTAVADTKTRNKSWLEISKLYKSMGIRNHAFMLALINPALQGVDPHAPDLTEEQMEMIAYECKINPWYFFREVARVPSLSGNQKPMLEANRGNIYLWWSFFNHVFTILIQIRQTGKSLSTDTLCVYLLHVLCTKTRINLMTKDDKLRRENVVRLKEIVDSLPPYLNQTTRLDADNGEEITVKRLGNWFKTHLPQSNKIRALNAGRGMSSPIFFIDEGPFQVNIRTALPAALAAMGAARENAKAAGEPYGVIMTTTAGKLNEDSGSYIYKFLESAATWKESYFDARDQEHLYELISANSKGKVPTFNGTFSHRQLGKSDEWLRERIAQAHAEGDDAERDFLNRWTSGTSSSPFHPDVAERIKKSETVALYHHIDPKFNWVTDWYITKEQVAWVLANRPLLLTLDTSTGTGKDFIGLIYLDPITGGVLGKANLNGISIYRFIEYIADLLTEHRLLTLVPERKSTGETLVDALLQLLPSRGIDPFARIFNWIVQDPITHADKYAQIQRGLNQRDTSIYVRYRTLVGYATTGSGNQSRDNLFRQPLNIATGKFAERIKDKDLIRQLLQLETRNGRIDHRSGGNDDLVISYLLGMWLLTSGKNLHHYGINPMTILSEQVQTKKLTPEELRRNQQQTQIRERIRDLLDKLKDERDDAISMKYERELLVLDNQLIVTESETTSMDELIRKANEERKRRLMQKRNRPDNVVDRQALLQSYRLL